MIHGSNGFCRVNHTLYSSVSWGPRTWRVHW
jgi:hypothetical protein